MMTVLLLRNQFIIMPKHSVSICMKSAPIVGTCMHNWKVHKCVHANVGSRLSAMVILWSVSRTRTNGDFHLTLVFRLKLHNCVISLAYLCIHRNQLAPFYSITTLALYMTVANFSNFVRFYRMPPPTTVATISSTTHCAIFSSLPSFSVLLSFSKIPGSIKHQGTNYIQHPHTYIHIV